MVMQPLLLWLVLASREPTKYDEEKMKFLVTKEKMWSLMCERGWKNGRTGRGIQPVF